MFQTATASRGYSTAATGSPEPQSSKAEVSSTSVLPFLIATPIRRAGRTDVHAPTPRFSPFFPRFPYTAPAYRSTCHPSFLLRSASARWSTQCFRAESLLILFRPLASRSPSDPAILSARPRHTASSCCKKTAPDRKRRSEEHTSELQSQF